MKLPLDRPTLDFLCRVSDYGISQVFEDVLFQYFFRTSLDSLKKKLSKHSTRIRKAYTLQLSFSEAICIRWALQMWNEAQPDTYAKDVLLKYFEPLQKAA